ncbi:MAG: adenosylcobyric acid synthase [Acetobacteraceae bacterium]|nr:adenosylcobyric acid synthase [Acetobacteraceae bacterium]
MPHAPRQSRALMFQGTGSDVGKSLIVAGLCRALTNLGMRVRPFKPQNMSNNAAVTADGGEIGRAQALQARACRVAPTVHMNPVLLKPQSDVGAQVVVRGKVTGNATARAFQAMKEGLLPTIVDSFERLRAEADIVLVEGAGSAAEVNLRANDIANMGFARRVDLPVILIGDIDRGGIIAQIVGTQAVLDPADAALIAAFLVNKFRGDPALFRPGMDFITARTHWPDLGLIPYFRDASRLPAEDAVALDRATVAGGGPVTVVVPRLAHIANFDDLDPLKLEPSLRMIMVGPGEAFPGDADLVILPGSKSTLADLVDFRRNGWDIDLGAHVRRGGRVLGLCGGYQLLGRSVADPNGIEGDPASMPGLGLLDVETVLTGDKTLTEVAGVSIADGTRFRGYEMHVGRTKGRDCARPLLRFADGRVDGATSPDGRIRGTYVHGLFSDDGQRAAFLSWIGGTQAGFSYELEVDRVLDGLADHLAQCVDLDRLISLAR